jgi:predicted ATPase
LELLGELIAGVSAGVGGVVLVAGEQGIGKSSLLRAAFAGAVAAGCSVFWAAADELGQQFPLRLMAECLDMVGGLEAAVAPLTQAAGVLAGDPVMAGMERMLAAVDRRCAQSPVVLVTEDLQWADETSLLVWSRLCQAVGQLPLLLAGSYRPGPGSGELARVRRGVLARRGTVVDLEPLPADEMSELVSGLVGGRPGRRLAGVVGRAGGNPLYARELADGLVREGGIAVTGGVAELAGRTVLAGVPGSLAAAIAERLAALAQDAVDVLRWAAVLGVEFAVPDLEVVSGRSAGALMGIVDVAANAGVLADAGPRLRFRHGLIRQVLYEGIPTALRAALHVEAARALADAGAGPERVAAQLAAATGGPGRTAEPATAPGKEAAASVWERWQRTRWPCWRRAGWWTGWQHRPPS